MGNKHPKDLPPVVGDRYRIIEMLGKGGTGTVHRAFDDLHRLEVALKVLHPAAEPGGGASLSAEFQVLAGLSHPNLAEVHDYGVTPGGLRFFTMELVVGDDIAAFLRKKLRKEDEPASSPLFLEVLTQVLAALDYIHTRGVIHEDLKPSNLLVRLVDGSPRVKLIDFGLARLTGISRLETSGTVEYMAPEKFRGAAGDPRSDLYSLGVLVCELLTGRRPFDGERPADVVRAHLTGDLPEDLLAGIPEPFRAVTRRLLSRSPADRFASAYEVLEAIDCRTGRAPALPPAFQAFVGRDEALDRLLGAFAKARMGRGARALIQGSAGIGKSRLLRELRMRLQLSGARVVVAASRGEGRRPGVLISLLLRGLALEGGLDPRGLEMQAALLRLLEEEGPEGPPAFGFEAVKERLIHQAADLFIAASETAPCAVLVDDIQAADTLDLQFLLILARRIRDRERCPLALYLASRVEDEADRRSAAEIEEEVRKDADPAVLSLAGLGEDEIRAYLAQVLGTGGAFPETLPAALARDTGGNPFFIEEFLKLHFARGGIARQGASWRVVPGAVLEIPGSVQEVIRRRLVLFRGLAREVLEWAALLDEPVSAREIREHLAVPEGAVPPREEVEAALDELVLGQLLARDGARWSILHRRIGAAVLETIPPAERRIRHRAIGERILGEGSLEAPGRRERLAHHLYHSDRPESAREHLLAAGARAFRSGALREAAGHLSRALEVIAGRRERFRALLDREQIWGLLGERERELADLRELAEIAEALDDPGLSAEAALREASFLDATGKKREAVSRYDQALDLVRRAGDRRAEARIHSRRAMATLLLGDFEASIAELSRSLELARAEGDRPQEAETCQAIGVGCYFRARYDEALASLARALSIRRDLGEEHRAGALESNIGLVHFDRGDFEAAEERFRASLRIFKKVGLRRGEAVNLVNLGLTHSEMGRYERAIDFIGEALRIRRELGDRWGEGTDLGNLGMVYVRLGRFERAVPLLEEALEIARKSGNRGSEGSNLCKMGIVEMQRGELDRAEERFREGKEIAAALRLIPLSILASTHLSRVLLLRGQPARALEEVTAALRAAEEAGMASWSIEALSLSAEALLEAGRKDEALAASEEAVARLGRFRGWMERSHEVWFIRSRVLDAVARSTDAREAGMAAPVQGLDPDEALDLAHALLLEKAEAIRDADLRTAYLENLPLHRRIVEAHAARRSAERGEASRRERSFYEISRSINSILELEPLLDRLLDLAVETTRAEKGMVLLLDPSGEFTVKAARDMAQESVADATDICRSVIADVSRRREAVLATDAKTDERFRERKSVLNFHIRSILCVPLTVRGELAGAVYVDSRSPTAFSQDDLLYLGSFAHLAGIAIENARLMARLRQENLHLRREIETRYRFQNLIGASAAMRAVFATMEKVARTHASVLITGETGTGKELIARALHYHGPRKDRPFVAVDCGALPETLLESELFGHKQGAFSGALHDRVGLFEEAAGGSIFLDEVTNTSPDLQAKLLRVLQEGEVRRVGENQYRKVDVRVIAATNLPIASAVAAGKFREDLYYRLNVVEINVPPLRERREDIPLLAAHFIDTCSRRLGRKADGFTEEAMARLVRAPWRGNVRELEHAIEKALILTERDRIGVEALDTLGGEPPDSGVGAAPAGGERRRGGAAGTAAHGASLAFDFTELSLEDFDSRWLEHEASYLRSLVDRAGGNYSLAARLAQVKNRNTLIARLKRHRLDRR
jgi:transcriptional regulator with GAF, ATPase, and Fis domain/tetratricopeptide (TPR) repeat protein